MGSVDLNPISGIEPVQLIKEEGVTFAYQDINRGSPPMLFVHGWGCDHAFLAKVVSSKTAGRFFEGIPIRGLTPNCMVGGSYSLCRPCFRKGVCVSCRG